VCVSRAPARLICCYRPPTHSTHTDPATWSIDDVAAWLQDIGLEQLRESFTENEISGSELLDLTMDEIKEDLDVKKLGTRKALWREIQALKSE